MQIRQPKYYLFLIVLLGTTLCTFNLNSKGLTPDEAYSLFISKYFSTMFELFSTEEANMWLYYLILHFWMIIGDSPFFIRFLSCIFFIVSIIGIYNIARILFTDKTAILSAFLFSIHPLVIQYAQTARSYAQTLLLVIISIWLFLIWQNTKKNKYLVAYLAAISLAVYSHLFAILVCPATFVISRLNEESIDFKKILWEVIPILVLILPIPFILPSNLDQVDWLNKPSIFLYPKALMRISGNTYILITIGLILLRLYYRNLILHIRILYKNKNVVFLLTWLLFPITVIFLFSYTYKPLFLIKYFIISSPAAVILFALVLESALKRSKVLFATALMIICITTGLNLKEWYKLIDHSNCQHMSSVILDNASTKAAILFFPYRRKICFDFYYDQDSSLALDFPILTKEKYFHGGSHGHPQPKPEFDILEQLHEQHDQVWIYSKSNLDSKDQQHLEKMTTILKKNYDIKWGNSFAKNIYRFDIKNK